MSKGGRTGVNPVVKQKRRIDRLIALAVFVAVLSALLVGTRTQGSLPAPRSRIPRRGTPGEPFP